MAAKRFVKSSIDWAAFAERVPARDKIKFQQFKAKVDNYTKNLMSLPEKPPTIDFATYRSRLPNVAMVNEFEKQYNSLKIPYPADKLTPLIDAQEKEAEVEIQSLKEITDLMCKCVDKEIQWLKNMMPFDQMSMDDYNDYFPDNPNNMYKYPNFWPHDEPPRPVFPYLEKKDH